ncbi:MAG TPA: rRNA maturation RNase YbeY [Candidatus Binatia bacterium]|nr:rRNA maturation RNase YbeY [Candidatus Binatia bacterium]
MPVEIVRRVRGRAFSASQLKKMALAALKLVDQDQSELSVVLVDNAGIRRLNARFRARDYPTDVLSFPAGDALPTGVRLLGDVVISVEKAKEQAKERRRSLKEEMALLLIHGIVHLLGYDHERSAKEARLMGRLEKKIYRELCDRGILEL